VSSIEGREWRFAVIRAEQSLFANRVPESGSDSSEDNTGIDAAKAKRVAEDVIYLPFPAVLRDNVEIAGRVGIFPIQGRWNPIALDR
jgi:hypothetical protein